MPHQENEAAVNEILALFTLHKLISYLIGVWLVHVSRLKAASRRPLALQLQL